MFVELDEVPEIGRGLGQRLVGAMLHGRFGRKIVPFLTGDLASLAADAGTGVDEFGDNGRAANAGRGGGTSGLCTKVENFSWHDAPPMPSPALQGSPCILARRSWDQRRCASRG